jgi:hypothetical protein
MSEYECNLLGGGVFGDGFGALRDGVLGEFSGEDKSDGSLDLPRGDGGPLVVVGKARGLGRDPLEDVVHEGVHDGHGLGGDAGVGVDLLQHLVDVHGVGLLPLLVPLLLSSLHNVLPRRDRLLPSCRGWHVPAVESRDRGRNPCVSLQLDGR